MHGRGRGHGRRAKGSTLREHRSRATASFSRRPPPSAAVESGGSDDDAGQDAPEPRRDKFSRRALLPNANRALGVIETDDDAATERRRRRELTYRLLTEPPDEDAYRQTFDHTAHDQALLRDAAQRLFEIDLDDLARSLERLPVHVLLRLPKEYADAADASTEDAGQAAPAPGHKEAVMGETGTTHRPVPYPAPATEPVPVAVASAGSVPSAARNNVAIADDLDDLLDQHSERRVPPTATTTPAVSVDADDADAELDRLLEEL